MKQFKYAVMTLLVILSSRAFADVRYISDDVLIYLHSGPGLDYRITGTLTVGTKVKTLKYEEATKFIQVKPEKGKSGWMKVGNLQQALPAKVLLPQVQRELKSAKKQLADTKAKNLSSQVEKKELFQQQLVMLNNLKKEKSQLQKQILALKASNLELDLLQETKESRMQMQWLLNGGGVLFFGLVIGLLLPFFPRRKKRVSTW